MDIAQIQAALNAAGFGPVKVDGKFGNSTKEAVTRFQRANNLMPDGKPGPKTQEVLDAKAPLVGVPNRNIDPPKSPASNKAAKVWPRQSEVEAFFGPAGSKRATAGTCKLPVAMVIAWDKSQRINSFKCHELVADAMTAIFTETVKHYGEANWRKLGLDLFGGCYNVRTMRGGSRPSMHSYGIATDIDPERNQLKWAKDRAVLARPEYVAFWNIVEGQGAISLGRVRNFDWMHFQFARL